MALPSLHSAAACPTRRLGGATARRHGVPGLRLPAARLRYALGTSRSGARGPMAGCGAAVRPQAADPTPTPRRGARRCSFDILEEFTPLPEPEFRHVLEPSSMQGAAPAAAWPCRAVSPPTPRREAHGPRSLVAHTRGGSPGRPAAASGARVLGRFASKVADHTAFRPVGTLSVSASSSSSATGSAAT